MKRLQATTERTLTRRTSQTWMSRAAAVLEVSRVTLGAGAVRRIIGSPAGMVFAEGPGRDRAEDKAPMRNRNRTWFAMGSTLACAIVVVAAAGGARADNDTKRPLPTFSSTVDVVNLNVSVSDGRDRYVTGLAAGDF